jgi:hypothetical protein
MQVNQLAKFLIIFGVNLDIYEETIPSNLPPSFRGQAIKYSYKLKIGLQRVGASVKLLHVPLRLMTWQSIL